MKTIEAAMKAGDLRPPWAERFAKADVPAGRVLSIPDDRQARPDEASHCCWQTVETEHGPIQVVGSGFRLEARRRFGRSSPAKLGLAYRRGAG